jgi:hypothetical protein
VHKPLQIKMTADKKQEQLDYTNRREIQQSIIDEALSRRCAYVMRANENNGHPTAASIKKGATTALRAITGKFEGQPNADDLKAQHQADVAKCNTIFKKYLPFEVRQEMIDMTAPEKWQHVLDYGKVGDAERVSALDRKMRETMFNQDRRYMEPFLKKMRAFHHQIMAINSTNHSKDQFFRVVLDNLGSCGQPEGTFYTTVTQLRGKSYLEDDDQEKLTWDILQSTLANLASQKSKSEGQEEEKAVLLSAIGKLDKRLSQQEKANAGGQSRRPGAPQGSGRQRSYQSGICYNWLDHGECSRGNCRFRHDEDSRGAGRRDQRRDQRRNQRRDPPRRSQARSKRRRSLSAESEGEEAAMVAAARAYRHKKRARGGSRRKRRRRRYSRSSGSEDEYSFVTSHAADASFTSSVDWRTVVTWVMLLLCACVPVLSTSELFAPAINGLSVYSSLTLCATIVTVLTATMQNGVFPLFTTAVIGEKALLALSKTTSFVMDSGATTHVVCSPDLFKRMTNVRFKNQGYIFMNSHREKIVARGDLRVSVVCSVTKKRRWLTLHNVAYVPTSDYNLFSETRYLDVYAKNHGGGALVCHTNEYAFIEDKQGHQLFGSRVGNLYKLECDETVLLNLPSNPATLDKIKPKPSFMKTPWKTILSIASRA